MEITEHMPILGGPSIPNTTIRIALASRGLPAAQRDSITAAFCALGELSRIGNLMPFAQAVHETGWFTSARWVKSHNPAGLGATNDGSWGGHFANPAEGITAQYAHLLAYAADDPQLQPAQRLLVAFDPRLAPLVKRGWRGVAPRWVDLNNRWAVPLKKGEPCLYAQAIAKIARQIARVNE